jgi:hypothetical protein
MSYMTLTGHDKNNLKMQFDDERFANITFIRTLRIPDDNKTYSLPPGVGHFPLHQVEDFADKLPENWSEHKGIFLPMYQSEAMWLRFNADCPIALKIAAGKINAISGKPWSNELQLTQGDERENSQPDYIVIPKQPWLDGFNVGKGLIKQFVAVPLGMGYTVEEQITGQAEHGGVQIIAYPMKKELWEKIKAEREAERGMFFTSSCLESAPMTKGVKRSFSGQVKAASAQMGLGQGGFMKQDIYKDEYGIEAWDTTQPLRIFVHLLNSLHYKEVTGHLPPHKPLGPKEYSQYHYPWFDYYDDGAVLDGSNELSKVDSIGSLQTKKHENILGDNSSINTPSPVSLGKQKGIKSGNW